MRIDIDGGRGEGGGQIVRSGLALSCITGRPVRIFNIRKNRRVPGLGAQHVTAARVLQRISGAAMRGAERGSTEIRFAPGDAADLDASVDVGTAGSIPLVMQVLVPAAAASGRRLKLEIGGGTDVPWSPTVDYARHVMGAAYARMGMGFAVDVHRRGYYPRGGGRVTLSVGPSDPAPATFSGGIGGRVRLVCAYSGVGAGAVREGAGAVRDALSGAGITSDLEMSRQDAADPGASLLAYSTEGGAVIGADALLAGGAFGLDPARLAGSPGVDDNLADMLVVPASVCGTRTAFRVARITRHLETNLYVASRITGCRYGIGRIDGGFEVIVDASHAGVKQGRKE